MFHYVQVSEQSDHCLQGAMKEFQGGQHAFEIRVSLVTYTVT